MLKIAEYSKRIEELKKNTQKALADAGLESKVYDDKAETIRLVFAGQYSAGKSSILKMLTGRTDIAVGEGITTQQAHTYDWNGIEVIDTPGIHTQLRPDHDEISYKAIASADMLIFVITNELFDSHMAEHFRKLAIDKDKAGEMILVVNKMDRAANGNSEEQQRIIRDNLRNVLNPYTPEQLHLSFLEAESYLDGVEESEEDPETAKELFERSGYAEFLDILERFIEEKKLPSKLTTELYMIDSQLEKSIKELQPNSSDSDVDALEENFMQQRHLLIDSSASLQQEVQDLYETAAAQIKEIGFTSANLLVEGCTQDEIVAELQKSIDRVNDIIKECQSEADKVINLRLEEMGQQLGDIENSEFSRNLKIRLNAKFEHLPDGIKKILGKSGYVFQKVGQEVMGNAYKAGVQGGLKLTNFSGSTIHELVLKIGHGVGYKFAPWQAIKITKGIAIGGQVLSIFGIAASVFTQIQADQDEEKNRENLRINRQNVRSQFNSVANDLVDSARRYIKDYVNEPLEASIAAIDDNIQEIRDTRQNKNETCHLLENLQKECGLLIRDIHSEYVQEASIANHLEVNDVEANQL